MPFNYIKAQNNDLKGSILNSLYATPDTFEPVILNILYSNYRIAEASQQVLGTENKTANLELKSLQQKVLTYTFLIGLVSALTMIPLIYRNYKSRKLTTQLRIEKNEEVKRKKTIKLLKDQEISQIKAKAAGQELEKMRIAKELHHGIGGTLSSIKMQLMQLSDCHENREVDVLGSKIDEVCQELRTICHYLEPPDFKTNAFIEVLESYIDDLSAVNKVKVNHEFYPKSELNTINEDLKTCIYRIIQELITNSVKHANASHITVQLIKHDSYVNLMVEDDGNGMPENNQCKGIGLINVMSRLELLNGSCYIDAKVRRGTLINIDIPYVELFGEIEQIKSNEKEN